MSEQPNTLTQNDVITQIIGKGFSKSDKFVPVIGDNVKYIDEHAFEGFSGIRKISLPPPLYVGDYAFNECSNLLDFPGDQLTAIGDNAFYGCRSLSSINLKNVVQMGTAALSKTGIQHVVNANIMSVPVSAFDECQSLVDVQLDNAKTILQYAFSNCSRLQNVSVSMSDSLVVDSSFAGCPELSGFSLPVVSALNFIGYIGTNESKLEVNAPKLTALSVTTSNLLRDMPESDIYQLIDRLHTLDATASTISLKSCTSLPLSNLEVFVWKPSDTTATLQLDNVKQVEFANLTTLSAKSLDHGLFEGDTKLESIKCPKLHCMPSAGRMFKDCHTLSSVDIHAISSNINTTKYMFSNCSNLISVDMSHVQSIHEADSMFKDCSSLVQVNLSTTSCCWTGFAGDELDFAVFNNCPKLESVDLNSLNEYSGQDIPLFQNCPNLTAISLLSYNDYIDGLFDELPNLDMANIQINPGTFSRISLNNNNVYDALSSTYGDEQFLAYISPNTTCKILRVPNIEQIYLGKIPKSIESIQCDDVDVLQCYLYDNTTLTSISLPNAGAIILNDCDYYSGSIGRDHEFSDFGKALISVDCPTVAIIQPHAFDSMSSLKYITLSPNIEEICEYAFKSCINLSAFNFGSDLTAMDETAFQDCHLTDISVDTTAVGLTDTPLKDGPLSSSILSLRTIKLGSNVIVDNVIESWLYGCDNLQKLDLTDSPEWVKTNDSQYRQQYSIPTTTDIVFADS